MLAVQVLSLLQFSIIYCLLSVSQGSFSSMFPCDLQNIREDPTIDNDDLTIILIIILMLIVMMFMFLMMMLMMMMM